MWLNGRKKCPCCETPDTSEEALRPVELVPCPKKKKSQNVAEYCDGYGNDECGSDDSEKCNESTNSRLRKSEKDEEVEMGPAEDRGNASWLEDGSSEMDEVEIVIQMAEQVLLHVLLVLDSVRSLQPWYYSGYDRVF
jgi:hypothetical protein